MPNSSTKTRFPSFVNYLIFHEENMKIEHKNHKYKAVQSSKTKFSQQSIYHTAPNSLTRLCHFNSWDVSSELKSEVLKVKNNCAEIQKKSKLYLYQFKGNHNSYQLESILFFLNYLKLNWLADPPQS